MDSEPHVVPRLLGSRKTHHPNLQIDYEHQGNTVIPTAHRAVPAARCAAHLRDALHRHGQRLHESARASCVSDPRGQRGGHGGGTHDIGTLGADPGLASASHGLLGITVLGEQRFELRSVRVQSDQLSWRRSTCSPGPHGGAGATSDPGRCAASYDRGIGIITRSYDTLSDASWLVTAGELLR